MKTYHYSVKFKGEDLLFHGEFKTSFVSVKDIKKEGKENLTAKMKKWGFEGVDVEAFEIYEQTNEGEKSIFKFSKE